jgi:hypothetical protein
MAAPGNGSYARADSSADNFAHTTADTCSNERTDRSSDRAANHRPANSAGNEACCTADCTAGGSSYCSARDACLVLAPAHILHRKRRTRHVRAFLGSACR